MIRARKLAHVGANLGDDGFGRRPGEARNLLQPFDGTTKGSQRSLDPRVEFPNGGFDLLDRLQVLADQEPVMIPRAAGERRRAGAARAVSSPERSLRLKK